MGACFRNLRHFVGKPAAERFFAAISRIVLPLAVLMLASCYPSGTPVPGVADTASWYSLPFDKFLHEGNAAPEAISFCAAPQCPHRLAVGILAITGDDARQLDRLLQKPDLLASELESRKRNPTLKRSAARGNPHHIETVLRIAPLRYGAAQGFTLVMSRKDGKGYIEGAVLGWWGNEALHVVIAIGPDAGAAEKAAIRAAAHSISMTPSEIAPPKR